jgi:D-alanyl-D-alanine dipeptidase
MNLLKIGFLAIALIGYSTSHAYQLHNGLVDIHEINPHIVIDLKYATFDNFVHEPVDSFQRCLLLEHVAWKLNEVQKELESMGLGLKIWDGFRSMKAQEKFWKICPDERYVSNPKKGGRHTRGTAIDVTIVTKDGQELLMPTGFDDFSLRAHRLFQDCSEERIQNRKLLECVMQKHGFIGLNTEWWHFDDENWKQYPPLEIDMTVFDP